MPRGRAQYLPLTAQESQYLARHKTIWTMEKSIHQVRAYKDEDGRWVIEGRSYNHRQVEILDPTWMSGFGMASNWRRKTIYKNPCYWYKVPISRTKGNPALPGCIPCCIMKFYSYVGMVRHSNLVRRLWENGYTRWGYYVDFIYRKRGFKMSRPSSIGLMEDLLAGKKRKSLFLLQISSINVTNQSLDNTHAICVFNNLIFDANHDRPLSLTRENLDKCCLGDVHWVFHHVSQVRQFSLGARLKKRLRVFC